MRSQHTQRLNDFYCTIGGGFLVLIDNNLTDLATDNDVARCGVLDTMNRAIDSSVDGAVLEGEVAVSAHSAVLHDKVFAVAEGLLASDMTTDETEILAIPTEVFSIDFRIIDRHVLCLPQCILGIKQGIVDFHVST